MTFPVSEVFKMGCNISVAESDSDLEQFKVWWWNAKIQRK